MTDRFTPTDSFQCYWPRVLLALRPLEDRQAYLHASVHNLLRRVSADVVYHEGQWFADLTHHQHQGGPDLLVQLVNERLKAFGRFAVGSAPGLTLARYASTIATPASPSVLAPWRLARTIESVPVSAILTHHPNALRRLAAGGVRYCGELLALTPEAVRKRWGEHGRRWWGACRGQDADLPVAVQQSTPLFAATLILPPRTRTDRALQAYLRSSCQKLARQLDRQDMSVRRLTVSLLTVTGRDISWHTELRGGVLMAAACLSGLRQHWQGQAIARLQVAADQVAHRAGQLPLFAA